MLPIKLQQKIVKRDNAQSLRKLPDNKGIDFTSNDYLGFSKNSDIFNQAHQFLIDNKLIQNGATGSRLLSGNYQLYEMVENQLSNQFFTQSALLFNSGYTANLSLFSTVPQRNDVVLYDEYIHASIRDGISMGAARSLKFKHNDLNDLQQKCNYIYKQNLQADNIYIVTESVFSMDGDTPNLREICKLCHSFKAYLIVDEAHALGVMGVSGVGIIPELGLEDLVFARIITFGKALGTHGAAVLGSDDLIQYLVNFSRPFIYTTALPPHTLATILKACNMLTSIDNLKNNPLKLLHENIMFFKTQVKELDLQKYFINSNSAIQSFIISGNNTVKSMSNNFKTYGFNIKPILSPTVPKGKERLRFCLHSYNSTQEISKVLKLLAKFVHSS